MNATVPAGTSDPADTAAVNTTDRFVVALKGSVEIEVHDRFEDAATLAQASRTATAANEGEDTAAAAVASGAPEPEARLS